MKTPTGASDDPIYSRAPVTTPSTPTGSSDDPFFTIEQKYGVSGRPIFTHGPVIRRFIIGYVFLSLGTVVGFYFSWLSNNAVKQERRDRSVAINQYLKSQCNRETVKDNIFNNILARSRASALSKGNKEYAQFITDSIKKVKSEDTACFQTIPPVIPK